MHIFGRAIVLSERRAAEGWWDEGFRISPKNFTPSDVRKVSMLGQLFEPVAGGPVQVRPRQVRVERTDLGTVWRGWILRRSLQPDRLCEVLLVAREEVPWTVMAQFGNGPVLIIRITNQRTCLL
jgi:hypothetical protein